MSRDRNWLGCVAKVRAHSEGYLYLDFVIKHASLESLCGGKRDFVSNVFHLDNQQLFSI